MNLNTFWECWVQRNESNCMKRTHNSLASSLKHLSFPTNDRKRVLWAVFFARLWRRQWEFRQFIHARPLWIRKARMKKSKKNIRTPEIHLRVLEFHLLHIQRHPNIFQCCSEIAPRPHSQRLFIQELLCD